MGGKGPRRWLLGKVHLEARTEPRGAGCRRWRPASRRGESTQGTCMKTVPGVGREHLQASRQACVRLTFTLSPFRALPRVPHWPSLRISLVPKCTIKCLFVFQCLLNWFWQKKIQIFKITEYWNYLMEGSLFLGMCMPPTGSFPFVLSATGDEKGPVPYSERGRVVEIQLCCFFYLKVHFKQAK